MFAQEGLYWVNLLSFQYLLSTYHMSDLDQMMWPRDPGAQVLEARNLVEKKN